MIQLKDIGIRKWLGNFHGEMPPLHSESYDPNSSYEDQGAHIGDIAIDESMDPNYIWLCIKDKPHDFYWVRKDEEILVFNQDAIAFIDKNGNDTTGEIGNSNKPFKTITGAMNHLNMTSEIYVELRLGVGEWENEIINILKPCSFTSHNATLINCQIINNLDDKEINFKSISLKDCIFKGSRNSKININNCHIEYNQSITHSGTYEIIFFNTYLQLPLISNNKVIFSQTLKFINNCTIVNHGNLQATYTGHLFDLNKNNYINVSDPTDPTSLVTLQYLKASNIPYDNTNTGITATDIQNAVSELKIYTTNLENSENIIYNNTSSGLSSTNIQDAIDEINEKANNIFGIKYSEMNYDILASTYNPDNERNNILGLVNNDWIDTTNKYGMGVNYVFKNGLYRVESDNPKKWVLFNNMDFQESIDIPYDNSSSNLSATNVQDALDEVQNNITSAAQGITYTEQNFDTLMINHDPSNVNEHTLSVVRNDWTDSTNKYGMGAGYVFTNGLYRIENSQWVFFDHLNLQNAKEVPVVSLIGFSATNVEDALQELKDLIDALHAHEQTITTVTDVIAIGTSNQLRKQTLDVKVLDSGNPQDLLVDQGVESP